VGDDGRPDLAEAVEVLGQRAVPVVADERADDLDAESLRRVDHLPQVAVHRLAVHEPSSTPWPVPGPNAIGRYWIDIRFRVWDNRQPPERPDSGCRP